MISALTACRKAATLGSDLMTSPLVPTAEMDRYNGRIFLLSYLLIYLAAPVMYVGVVQAALCDKLGANATVSNLPFAAYQLGQVAPLFFSWLIPHRHERATVGYAGLAISVLLALVSLTLLPPIPNTFRIAVVILQGLMQGLLTSALQVFMFQCLNRGSSLEGRARALQQTFSLGPLFAVAGSLGAQFMLNAHLSWLRYPRDFALMYGLSSVCMAGVAWLSFRYRLVAVDDEPRRPFLPYMADSARAYGAIRGLILLWLVYLLWNCTLGAVANLSLYTREAIGRDPKDLSGLILAIRFGCKSAGGLLLGFLAVRYGLRTSVMTTITFFAVGVTWAWFAPGYSYLLAFGLLGAGELGGAYIPNLGSALSPLAAGARNMSILTLATPVSSFAPALHGWFTDRFGFRASFIFGLATAIAALAMVLKIPAVQPAPPAGPPGNRARPEHFPIQELS
jgi:MFS family permease